MSASEGARNASVYGIPTKIELKKLPAPAICLQGVNEMSLCLVVREAIPPKTSDDPLTKKHCIVKCWRLDHSKLQDFNF